MSGRDQSSLDDAGWQALLAEVARANSNLLLSMSLAILGNRADAEDVCQSALAFAWEQRQKIRTPGRLLDWLKATVRTESLRILRRRKTERRVMSLTAKGPGEAGTVSLISATPDLREATILAMDQLEDDERAVVALRCMQEIPGREVGGILGIKDPQVTRLLYRGMEKLRRLLADWDHRKG